LLGATGVGSGTGNGSLSAVLLAQPMKKNIVHPVMMAFFILILIITSYEFEDDIPANQLLLLQIIATDCPFTVPNF